MVYNLTEYQIEEILREGKFDKEKYAHYMSIVYFNAGDCLYDYEQKHIMPLIKDKNKLYEMMAVGDHLSDITVDYIFDDIDDCITASLKEVERLAELDEIV